MTAQLKNPDQLARQIKTWGGELGFQQIGISDTDLDEAEIRLFQWLERGMHGEMDWMARHGARRSRPQQLVAGTVRVICARMDYMPASAKAADAVLDDPASAFISRYSLGRDYHKVMRRRLAQLASRIEQQIGPFGYRVFTDSAPVLEKPLAEKAGLGWIGKHTNVINQDAGSWFFLGEIYTDLELPVDRPAQEHCGSCRRCIDVCPTEAIVEPWLLDARLCVSYLTIEHPGSIPVSLRKPIGNRIYGCDDCQMVCPWNKFSSDTQESDFEPRHQLDASSLVRLFALNEQQFLAMTEGSAIRRIGYQRWVRNIAVALGNAPTSAQVVSALQLRRDDDSALIREHVQWALSQHASSDDAPA